MVGVEKRVDKIDGKENFIVHLVKESGKTVLACTGSIAGLVCAAIS